MKSLPPSHRKFFPDACFPNLGSESQVPFGNPNYTDRLPVRLRGTPKGSEHPLESQQENLNLTCWASKYHQGQTHRNQHPRGNSNRGVKSQSMPSTTSGFPNLQQSVALLQKETTIREKVFETRFLKVCWHTSTWMGSVQVGMFANIWPTAILVSQKEVSASLSATFPNTSSRTKEE